MSTTINEETVTARPLLLDDLVPVFDATRIEHRVVDRPVGATYAGLLEADFMQAWKGSTAVRALFAARSVAEELLSRARGRDGGEQPELPSMRLADMPTHGEWVRLGEDPPHELAFGTIGRFWGGETKWREIDARDFVGYSEPGLAKIGCNFSLRAYGSKRTLLSYEARTKATDEESRRHFLRYWRAVSPGVGIVMRSMLAVVEEGARR